MTDLAAELRDIERKLFEIPDEKVAQLTLLIERSRAVIMSSAMADAALGTLRPRLAKTRPPRYLTLQRIFVHPFEDLLILPEGTEKQFGRVSRRSLAPVWEFLLARIDKEAVAQMEASLRKAPMPDVGVRQDPRITHFGETFWAVSAACLRGELQKADADAAYRSKLEADLGGAAILQDLADMTAMLELAEPLERLREELSPKPVGRLLDDQVEAIKAIYLEAAGAGKAPAGYLLAMAIARLTDGFQIIALADALGEVDSGVDGMRPGQFVRAMLAGDSKRALGSMTRTDPEKVSDSSVADMLGDFSNLLARLKRDGMAENARSEIDRAARHLKQMVQVGVLGGIDEKVLGGISAVLTPPAADTEEAARQAVFAAKVDAEGRIYALQKVAKTAADIGADKEVAGTLKSLSAQIEQTGAALLADIKAGRMNAEGREAVKLKVFAAVRMLELVAGNQAASRLMKDGMAALAKMPG